MKIFGYGYLVLSMLLIIFLGTHYYKYQFDKKVVYVDKTKEELISYFNEICLGSEYGSSKKVTRKWQQPLKLYIVKDSAYDEQMLFIAQTIKNINALVSEEF